MSDTPPLESAEKLFSILEHLVREGGAGVTEIARATSLPKSTVHLHLQSLGSIGVVEKDGDDYRATLQLFEWGERIRNGIEPYRKGREEVDALAEETNELVNLGVVEDGQVRLVYFRNGEESANDTAGSSISTEFRAEASTVSMVGSDYAHSLGTALPMHSTAMGKAILAELPDGTVESIVDRHGLPAFTEDTITNEDELFAELERIRSEGFAEDDEERTEGLCCIAAAVRRDDEPVAAVSVSGPTDRMSADHRNEIRRSVINTANVIEVKLTHS